MTQTLLLTAEERERFAAWLEADAQADEMLAERLSEVLQGAAASAMTAERRADAEAKRRVSRQLRSTMDVFVAGEKKPQ